MTESLKIKYDRSSIIHIIIGEKKMSRMNKYTSLINQITIVFIVSYIALFSYLPDLQNVFGT